MWQAILIALGKELLGAVIEALQNYNKRRKNVKKNKSLAKEIVREKDPQIRAKRMHDFLNN